MRSENTSSRVAFVALDCQLTIIEMSGVLQNGYLLVFFSKKSFSLINQHSFVLNMLAKYTLKGTCCTWWDSNLQPGHSRNAFTLLVFCNDNIVFQIIKSAIQCYRHRMGGILEFKSLKCSPVADCVKSR